MSRAQSSAVYEGGRSIAHGLALAVLALLPFRSVVGAREAATTGTSAVAAATLGIVADMLWLTVPWAALLALCLLLGRSRRRVTQVLVAAAVLALWAASITVSESLLSRGVYPTWVDGAIMLRSPAMMQSSLGMYLLPRNVIPSLLVLPLALWLLLRWPRPASTVASRSPCWCRLGGGLAVVAAWLGAVHAIVFLQERWGGATSATPMAMLAPSQLNEAMRCLSGPCEPASILVHADTHPEMVSRGAAMLGWPAPGDDAKVPFRRKLPPAELVQCENGGTPSIHNSDALPWLRAFTTLSAALFAERRRPVHVWHIALEGMRADDLQSLNPAAPRALAPFLNGLHDRGHEPGSGVLASQQTWGAGVRTPQGMAALLCGLGTLPHGLALPRDIPAAPARCLTDVLADAEFDASYGYGGDTRFDKLGSFFARHGLRPAVPPHGWAPNAARTAWGVTDRTLYGEVLSRARRDETHSTYTLLLSLSHHHPFALPSDVTTALSQQVARTDGFANLDDNAQARLLAFAYADAALQEFVEGLKRDGLWRDSILVISADHSLPEPALWRQRSGAISELRTKAQIPLLFHIAPEIINGAANPTRALQVVAELQHRLATDPLAQNDIPTLLLALLSELPELQRIASGQAWHTMGGQRSSPWYRSPGPAGTHLHGIHAATALYFVDRHGKASAPVEPAPLVVHPDSAARSTPSLKPAAAALRHWLDSVPDAVPSGTSRVDPGILAER